MHHFIYPTQDAYISNKSSEINKNFGLDELLVVGVSRSYAHVTNYTKTYSYSNEYVAGMKIEDFTGKFTGSALLYFATSTGSIVGGYNNFSSTFFSGSLTGSVSGYETGSSFTNFNFSGSLRGFSGSIVANSINGLVSGSLSTTCFSTFTGTLNDSSGSLTGYLTGDDIRNQQNTSIINRRFVKRSLLKFDLSFISQSIVSGDIINPKFYLKMYVTEAKELPVEYSIFVFPLSQTWVQGDGYWSDEGSNEGVSWNWRNKYSGSVWFTPQRTDIITSSIDYLGNYGYVSESFLRGGGTWYNVPCSQSFSYESADLDIDVTSIVNSWLNRSIVNNGLIVMCSEETNPSGSNAHMFFFSRETNTIYSPHLDVAWDDSVWLTGSFGTGSVTITHYPSRFSGSISSGVSIIGKIAHGNLSGNSFLITNQNGVINSGSSILTRGNSGTINGLLIEGNILGTSSIDVNGTRFISASLTTGDFTGCQIEGEVSESVITGFLSGSFNGNVFLNYGLSGSIPTLHGLTTVALQNSSIGGDLLGYVYSSSFSGGTFNGVFVNGLLKGATATIPFTGSYSYLTSSVSFTSSVVITGSSFSNVNSEKPFVITIQNLKKEYSFGDNPRINIFARESLPLKTFDKTSQQLAYLNTKLLPSSSFYAIQDNETEEFIIDFDNYTRISCDLDGHYFNLNTSALAKERYYKIVVKVECVDGNIYTFDNNAVFQIRR
jgi:hypothetical protein